LVFVRAGVQIYGVELCAFFEQTLGSVPHSLREFSGGLVALLGHHQPVVSA